MIVETYQLSFRLFMCAFLLEISSFSVSFLFVFLFLCYFLFHVVSNLLFCFHLPGIGIHIHVTPYQVHDERRPWIRKEEKAFGDLLRRLGAPVHRTLHFENQAASLYTHFEVLSAFRQAAK